MDRWDGQGWIIHLLMCRLACTSRVSRSSSEMLKCLISLYIATSLVRLSAIQYRYTSIYKTVIFLLSIKKKKPPPPLNFFFLTLITFFKPAVLTPCYKCLCSFHRGQKNPPLFKEHSWQFSYTAMAFDWCVQIKSVSS